MKIVFFHSDKPRERLLAEALGEGIAAHGRDEYAMHPLVADISTINPEKYDVACLVGVKARELFRYMQRAEVQVLYFDKGYERRRMKNSRIGEYWRVAVNAHQPTSYLMDVKRKSDRWDEQNFVVRGWREVTSDGHILVAGSSQKYHDFYGLNEPNEYYQDLVKRISKITKRKIIYRPKPSYKEALPVDHAEFSPPGDHFGDLLFNAHVVVTHGSNACFDSVVGGVPTIVLGEGVTKAISSHDIEDVESPLVVSNEERMQLLYNLAYCQWTHKEFASGLAWQHIRPLLYG